MLGSGFDAFFQIINITMIPSTAEHTPTWEAVEITPSFETLTGIIVDGPAVIPVLPNTSISISKVEDASI
jgi:hypothetical protein